MCLPALCVFHTHTEEATVEIGFSVVWALVARRGPGPPD